MSLRATDRYYFTFSVDKKLHLKCSIKYGSDNRMCAVFLCFCLSQLSEMGENAGPTSIKVHIECGL